jgi:hypothetical protein
MGKNLKKRLITLNSLRELCDPIPYSHLRGKILDAGK